ncbi:MAG: hypothetical protein ACD_34C00594G0001 [uncultured bacterium]|nr:MAG: hypothetical protein ACD_34C00594G0001 [uncultured bacterium]
MANIHHLVQMVKITAEQMVPAVSLFKITSYAHKLISQRKNRFRNSLIMGVKACFHNRPWIALKVSDWGFMHVHGFIPYS